MTETSFGRRISQLVPADLLAAEPAAGRDGRFTHQEAVLANALAHAAAGERVLAVLHGKRGDYDSTEIIGLGGELSSFVADEYALTRQESRGAWFLPQELSIKPGMADLGWHMSTHPRFAMNAVRDEAAKVDLRNNPHALATWALISPFFDTLFAPLDLSAPTGKDLSAAQRAKIWADNDTCYRRLGLALDDVLAPLRPGAGWTRLRIAEQTAARQRFVQAVLAQASPATVTRWRALVVQQLAGAYYKKAKRGGGLARSVLTKALHPHLAGYFGGDWLAFLDYLGEQPADGESVVTSLPETKLFVGAASARVAEVAAEHDLPVDEVARMLGAYLGAHAGVSPVDERVSVMRRWWDAFDAVHAAQAPGMPPLWGLVDEGFIAPGNEMAPEPGIYRRLLPPDLVAEVNLLWDGVTLPRWPERIVSEFHPHQQMAQAFGPAVEFWNGVALTCWYLCEGPYSRTTLGALSKYHHKQIKALDEAGTPINRALFRELEEAERGLGPVQELRDSHESSSVSGITITISTSHGQRRDGFEILRDVVTRHRRAWAAVYLDNYLKHRWDNELRAVAQEYNRRLAGRGKPPTFKQFASFAADAANHWFNGDLGAVFASFGERSPASTERIDLLVGDPIDFVRAVYQALGGTGPLPREAAWEDRERYNRNWQAGRLASQATRYLQLQEALGRPPDPREFGADKERWDDIGSFDTAWPLYIATIDTARQIPAPPTAPSISPPPAPTNPQYTPPPTPPPPSPRPLARPASQAPSRRTLFNRFRGR